MARRSRRRCVGVQVGPTRSPRNERYAFRGWAQRFVEKHPRFKAVDAAMDEGGLKVLLLLRLSPVMPFVPLNDVLGLTSVRLWKFAVASLIGALPGTLLYTYLGTVVGAALGGRGTERSWQEWLYLALGLAATAVGTLYLTRLAKKHLHRQQQEAEDGESSDVEAEAAV